VLFLKKEKNATKEEHGFKKGKNSHSKEHIRVSDILFLKRLEREEK